MALCSLSAWLVKRDTAVPLLNVEILDVDLAHVVLLVLEVLVNSLLYLIFEHPLGIYALFIVRLTVIIHVSPNNVIANQPALFFARVKEWQI